MAASPFPRTWAVVSLALVCFVLATNAEEQTYEDIYGKPLVHTAEMWGNIYMRGSVNEIEFYRALFGGRSRCGYFGVAHAVDKYSCTANTDIRYDNKIVLIQRGECHFERKARVAAAMGAAGVVVVNTKPGLLRMPKVGESAGMGTDLLIPVVMIKTADGRLLASALERNPDLQIKLVSEQVTFVRGEKKLTPYRNCTHLAALGVVSPQTEEGGLEGGSFHIHSPPSLADKKHEFLSAFFGGPLVSAKQSLVAAQPLDACAPLTNDAAAGLKGKYVLVKRGGCLFSDKAHNVEVAGGYGAVVFNTDPGLNRMFGGELASDYVTIPAVMISHEAGESLVAALGRGEAATISVEPTSLSGEDYDVLMETQKPGRWPDTAEAREHLLNNLILKHSPDFSKTGHPERVALIQRGFDQAQVYWVKRNAAKKKREALERKKKEKEEAEKQEEATKKRRFEEAEERRRIAESRKQVDDAIAAMEAQEEEEGDI